ncbi:DUF192 domain-containing protein [Bordetella petrii]|uniref:DUF192 domain-containing protein n=1 Tax=Bordetella petrii TaxID=94624 RepID=UPI001A9693CD|nr:DUF192 domain-containing protein [Bordetella petrii]MBO1110627.1 DUF192 domain-containing protein [Bordetella petrii]
MTGNRFRRGLAPGRIRVVRAQGALGRLRGLLCRARALGPHTGLLLTPCCAVHTLGMRYSIDVAFIDAGGRVLRLARNVRPGRLVFCRGAAAVVELAVNTADTPLRRRRRLHVALRRMRAGKLKSS